MPGPNPVIALVREWQDIPLTEARTAVAVARRVRKEVRSRLPRAALRREKKRRKPSRSIPHDVAAVAELQRGDPKLCKVSLPKGTRPCPTPGSTPTPAPFTAPSPRSNCSAWRRPADCVPTTASGRNPSIRLRRSWPKPLWCSRRRSPPERRDCRRRHPCRNGSALSPTPAWTFPPWNRWPIHRREPGWTTCGASNRRRGGRRNRPTTLSQRRGRCRRTITKPSSPPRPISPTPISEADRP